MRKKPHHRDRIINFLLLLLWSILGLALRLTNLDLKPASSIEIATIGYSLGHGFAAIPLDRVVTLETLLAPLRWDSALGYADVFGSLTTQSTHPPLYFWLTHWWLGFWLQDGDLVPLQVARSLSAVLGTLAIPACYSLGWVAFRSRLTAHLAAVLMATSPYGIYLAQEARHYTLSVLWIVASMICALKAVRAIAQHKSVPLGLSCLWVGVNALGVATHYFFVIALGAEAIAILVCWLYYHRQSSFKYWRSLYLAGCGTLAGCLVWLPLVRGIADNEITTWIQTSLELKAIWLPPVLMLGWMQSMVMLLPVEGVPLVIAISSVLVMAIVVIWTVPKFAAVWRSLQASDGGIIITSSYLVASIFLFLLIIYGWGRNLSLAARYQFVYFPLFVLAIAFCLGKLWDKPKSKSVIVVLLLSFLGSLTVINNYGYQKSQQLDSTAAFIQQTATNPAVIATRYQTHSQTRELIALAYSFQRLQGDRPSVKPYFSPKFLLNRGYVEGEDRGLYNLHHAIDSETKPLDLWAINLGISAESLEQIRCSENNLELLPNGELDRLYVCQY